MVDNTFSPLILSLLHLGADVVVYRMTQFINGTHDCVAGSVVASHDFIARLCDINGGASMLLGPVLDSIRAANLLKNLHSLHLRMVKHGEHAMYLAGQLQQAGLCVHYPGLATHPQHALLVQMMNRGFGFGGIVAVAIGTHATAKQLMMRMQEKKVGYLAVSLGYFKTLFSSPGQSTSSEMPAEQRHRIGLGDGLVRFSVGLDNDIEHTWAVIKACLQDVGIPLDGPPAQ